MVRMLKLVTCLFFTTSLFSMEEQKKPQPPVSTTATSEQKPAPIVSEIAQAPLVPVVGFYYPTVKLPEVEKDIQREKEKTQELDRLKKRLQEVEAESAQLKAKIKALESPYHGGGGGGAPGGGMRLPFSIF